MLKLKDLRNLYLMQQAAAAAANQIDSSALEREFLYFSAKCPTSVLRVHLPQCYQLSGDQQRTFKEALHGLKIDRATPTEIDITGNFDLLTALEAVIIISPQQIQADHYSSLDSYLNPLIERIYGEGSGLIRDFTTTEALAGKVVVRRGGLDLQEVSLFPERFFSGPYSISLHLDTPDLSVQRLREVSQALHEVQTQPREGLLNAQQITDLTTKALLLRSRLGALARYEVPEQQDFTTEINSYVLRTKVNTQFFLYHPETDENVLVYFGDHPFQNGQAPTSLLVLSGKEHQHTLNQLIAKGFYVPSETILNQKIADLENLQDQARRAANGRPHENGSEITRLIEELKRVQTYFNTALNPEYRQQYCLEADPSILELLVCPATTDPVIHELLPRLSWDKNLRNYSNSGKFIALFESADETKRKELLDQIRLKSYFNRYQNNDVNAWLYQRHQQFCLSEGLTFELV